MTRDQITPPEGGSMMFDHIPDAWASFNRFYGELWTNGVLPQTIKETARLRNARITDCGI